MHIRSPKTAAAAAIAVTALLAAGCSGGTSSASHDQVNGHDADHHGQNLGAPGVEHQGDNGRDQDAEAAKLNPAHAHGTKVSAFTATGYRAHIDLSKIPSSHAVRKAWQETPKPRVIEGDQATAGPLQTKPPKGTPPALRVNVPGLDYAAWGAGHPPDTSGAVGPDNYIQTVNTSVGVFDKSGNRLDAFTFNSFFSQFHSGTPCDNVNGGDPQVIFDQATNKWLVSDLSYPGPYYECLAVSDGPSINRTDWTLYPILASQTALNDYPKIASGANGIYYTFNMFQNGAYFNGAEVWAIKRGSLGKKHLKIQRVDTSNQYGSLLPANTYAKKPGSGVEYLMSLETTTKLGLWKFDVNWKNPANSTFTQTPTLITVDAYQTASSVPELGGTALDSLSDRPMYQLQLHKGTLWLNHSVQTAGVAGVRWYQIGNIDATPKVLQQSTYAPSDGLSRWMGSLAVDKAGNMAVGFSTSSSSTHPGIRYATRKAGAHRNRLQAEGTIIQGNGSQTVTSRWGDYSQMSIDPTDHCTFWYTTEYYDTTGGDWQTQIASFKFANCT